ncbi:MAG: carboxypeptidase regulatory-like domain-containing protein, partial [Lachnospiraceae bacterium]|nr:carboxypeptidase regulatory-like domain-containing protein [Lachnospiraceae bacterium]
PTEPEVKEQAYKLYPAITGEIDIYEEKVKPAKRNYKAKWDKRIFYGLEKIKGRKKSGKIKTYEVIRKTFVNKKNKNRIEYEIYRNPKTGKINKIVSVEYRKKDLEITDYYYTDKGKVNFIYQRKDSIYTPTYASPDKTGSRYYFDKDTLIKWRWVNKPLDVKELVLKRDKKSIAKVQYLYKKSKKKDRKHYDKREIKMLNAAYNTYEAMLKENEYGGITGNIVNTKGKALKDVKIAVYFGAEFVGEITTDKKGKFETGISPNKEGYKLKITKEGFADTEVENVTVKDTDSIVLTDKIMLVKAGEGKKKLKFNVFDAEATKYNNKRAVKKYIDKVKIKVRKGTDNRAGEVIAESKSDNKGNINLSLENGIYTIEFVKKGFVKSYQTIAVEKKSAMNIPLVKKMKKNQLKIVLTWEGDKDIDSSLFTPYQGKGGDMAYIGADTKKDKHGNRLVLDGKQGNTTEVIILDNVKAGNYKYYVSDYTNSRKKKFSSKDMKKLKLKVVVYDENGVVGYYTLPYDVNGVVWEVFEIKNGKLIPLQKTYSNISGKKWWTNDKELIARKAALEKKRLYEIRKFETEILPAYEKYVRENFQGSSLDEPYSFIYLDDDYIPELVIDTGVQASGTNIVTYANRAVGTTVGPNVGYIERYNLLLVVGGHQGEYYDAVYSIRNGDLVEVWRGMWEENVDENGNFIYRYYINSEEVSQEEYRSRLSNLVGNNSMNSGQFIYAPTIREAYAKFKAVKGM